MGCIIVKLGVCRASLKAVRHAYICGSGLMPTQRNGGGLCAETAVSLQSTMVGTVACFLLFCFQLCRQLSHCLIVINSDVHLQRWSSSSHQWPCSRTPGAVLPEQPAAAGGHLLKLPSWVCRMAHKSLQARMSSMT